MTTPPGDQPPHGEPQPPYSQGDPAQGGYSSGGYPPGGYPPGGYPPGGYPPGGYPPYGGFPVQQDHPKAQTAMVLGILGLVLCQVLAPFAWVIGKRTVAEIDASGGWLGGRSAAQTGYVLGIVGSVLLGLGVLFMLIYLVFIVVLIGGTAASS